MRKLAARIFLIGEHFCGGKKPRPNPCSDMRFSMRLAYIKSPHRLPLARSCHYLENASPLSLASLCFLNLYKSLRVVESSTALHHGGLLPR